METIIGILLALGAALGFIFKTLGDKRKLHAELEIEKAKKPLQARKDRVRDAEIARQGAKLGYERAKKDFKSKYSKYIPTDTDSSD